MLQGKNTQSNENESDNLIDIDNYDILNIGLVIVVVLHH